MKTSFCCAAAILAVAGVSAVSAQTTIIERNGPAVIEREGPTTIERERPAIIEREGPVVTHQRVELTPAQRTTIYRTITRERVVPQAAEVRVGARVPRTATLAEIPSTVIEEVPAVQRYRYMVVNNEVVLVDPATSEVVEIIRQ